MFTNKLTPTKQLSTIYDLQQLHDLAVKLESAQQEIQIIELEKIEYAKEIEQIKHQNEELIKENAAYSEISKAEKQEISYLRSVSMNVNEINLHNLDLNKQVSGYEKLIKKLKSKNINLQKENEKYKIILEELNKEKQKRDEIHVNNTLNLENKIKDLENECDGLREEINKINTLQITSDEEHYELSPTISPKYEEQNVLFRLSLNGKDVIPKELFSEFGYNENIETEIIIDHEDDIINQLIQCGYNENDIITAINMVHDKNNINDIAEMIENNKLYQHHNEVSTKIDAKIDEIITTSKIHINKLRDRVILLTQQNHQLMLIINKKK